MLGLGARSANPNLGATPVPIKTPARQARSCRGTLPTPPQHRGLLCDVGPASGTVVGAVLHLAKVLGPNCAGPPGSKRGFGMLLKQPHGHRRPRPSGVSARGR